MRQRFPPPLKTSQYWFSKESWTCTPMKQWAQKGVNGETAGEFQVSHSRMFHEQFVHDAKVTNGWIYDLYIWTTSPIFSKAGYHRNAWNLYKMFEQRQNQSRRVSGVHRTSFIFTPQLSIRPIARAAQEDSLFWAVKGLLSCVWSFPHLILKSFNMETQISFFQALKSIQARALATCDQLSQGRENNWACACFTETHGTWPDINSLIGHAKQSEAFSFVSRNLKCKFFHRAFFDFFLSCICKE